MSGYSSIFSSGLLATPRPNNCSDDADCSTPDSPINVEGDPDATPTKLNSLPIFSSEDVMSYFMPRSRASSNASATASVLTGAPRLRRRRSSLSIASNGLSAVKSPQRNAGVALQRTTLMGPGARARSGSIDVGPTGMPRADEEGYVLAPSRIGGGQSRSGSTDSTCMIRPRRTFRRPPPVPPPNAPLPPPPTSVATTEVVHRRPLVNRAHTAENFSATCLAPPFELMDNLKITAAMGTTPSSSSPLTELSAFWGPGVRANEN